MPESSQQLQKIESLKKAYASCFGTKSGQEVMKDLEKKLFYHGSTISKEPHMLIFREGQRSALLHIKTMIKFDVKKIKEINEQQNEEE